MNKIEYRIMGVPSRIGNIRLLQSQLGISDKETFIDTEYRRNPMWTWKQTVGLSMNGKTTHLCVIQDDAVLCDGFMEFCNYMVNRFPCEIIFLSNWLNLDGKLPDYCISYPGCCCGGVVTVVPVQYIDSMIDYQEKEYPEYIHDDNFICYWGYLNGIKTIAPYPSVIDTLEDSTLGHNYNHPHKVCLEPMKYKWINATKIKYYKNRAFEKYGINY